MEIKLQKMKKFNLKMNMEITQADPQVLPLKDLNLLFSQVVERRREKDSMNNCKMQLMRQEAQWDQDKDTLRGQDPQ